VDHRYPGQTVRRSELPYAKVVQPQAGGGVLRK